MSMGVCGGREGRKLTMDAMLIPKARFRSARNLSKPSARRSNATNDTCDESIACNVIPFSFTSQLASVTRSLRASIIFLRRDACCRRASAYMYRKGE